MGLTIGQQRQLFIDDFVIEEASGTRRLMHQPEKHPANPVVIGDQPWERWAVFLLGGSQVRWDPQRSLFQMWYRIDFEDVKHEVPCVHAGDTIYLAAYAESTCGVHWSKPVIGDVEFLGLRQNNLIGIGKSWVRRPGVIFDDRERDPSKRYKMLYVDVIEDQHAMCIAYSADGIHWRGSGAAPWARYAEEKSKPAPSSASQGDSDKDKVKHHGAAHHPNLVGWDENIGKYLLYPRIFVEDNSAYYAGLRRAVGRAVSDDFEHWQETGLVLAPDEHDPPDLDIAGFTVMPYEGVYLGFIGFYHHSGEMDRRIDTQLAFSRDGIQWQRSGERQTFLGAGPPGSFDDWWAIPTTPLVVGDEIWMYYGSGNTPMNMPPHVRRDIFGKKFLGRPMGQAIGLAKLRLDGFVSLSASLASAAVVTKPFNVLESTRLVINADASRGSLAVEVLDPQGHSLKGRSLSECDPLRDGDEVRHTMTWKGQSELFVKPNTPIRLRFHLENCHLFSFQLAK